MKFTSFVYEQNATAGANATLGQAKDSIESAEQEIANVKKYISTIPDQDSINGAGVISNIIKSRLVPAYNKLAIAHGKHADSMLALARANTLQKQNTPTV